MTKDKLISGIINPQDIKNHPNLKGHRGNFLLFLFHLRKNDFVSSGILGFIKAIRRIEIASG